MTLDTWELISIENVLIISVRNTLIKVYSVYTVVVGTLLKAAHLVIYHTREGVLLLENRTKQSLQPPLSARHYHNSR
jgi:hypothetical protein